nr:MAG TPA: hypothetical protein [Caudoviricetes sp.]
MVFWNCTPRKGNTGIENTVIWAVFFRTLTSYQMNENKRYMTLI